jgi:hypothetical protein
MKRVLAILLICTLAFSFTACRKDNPTDNEQSDDISTTSEQPVSAQIQTINRMLGAAPDRTKGRTNILKGITYKPSAEPGSNGSYVDTDHKKLTDGVFAESFNTHSWAGFTESGIVTLTFDLGKTVENIADIEVGCLRQLAYGIGLPGYVDLFTSEDGKNYTRLGRVYMPSDVSETQKYVYVFRLQGVINTQYIQIKYGNPEKGFVFIDEVAAYVYDGGGSEVTQVSDYYEPFTPDANKTYWDEKEADYATKQNLAVGKKFSIISFSSIDSTNAVEKQNSLPSNGVLTDGTYAEYAGWDRADVFRFTQGDGRQIIIDLEKICAVSEVKGDFLQQAVWGIRLPEAVGVSVSENGTDWQGVATVDITSENKDDIKLVKFTADFKKVYRARYIKVQFLVTPFAALSEIEVIGTKKIPADAVTPDPDADVTRLRDRYITPDEFEGINNILCNPVCRGDGTNYDESAMITHDEFLKYVGYYEDGKLKDTFFDTFLFSPCSDFTNANDKTGLKGWKFYVDSQFVADRNLHALNAAAKTVGEGVGQNDLKINVFLSILRTFPKKSDGSVNNFGDIDGDGVDDAFDNIENRKKAIKWMIDTQLKKYTEANFDRLKLVGFYWQEEVIFVDDPEEVKLIQWTVDYVHKLGYKLMWIPYYQAEGFEQWRNYGFDLACLQPNYSFMSIIDEDRLDSTAYQAKMHGMCVEIELDTYTDKLNIERYKEYLEYGVKYGYMNAVKVYYLGVIPTDLTQALTSEDSYTRSVYRDTYLFAKGKLDESYNKQSDEKLVAPKGTSVTTTQKRAANGKIEIEDASYRTLTVTVSPKYGSLKLNLDGSFTYTPFDTYTGTDSFCVAAVYASGVSESAMVNITVE